MNVFAFATGIEHLSTFHMFHMNTNKEEIDFLVKICIYILTSNLVSFICLRKFLFTTARVFKKIILLHFL